MLCYHPINTDAYLHSNQKLSAQIQNLNLFHFNNFFQLPSCLSQTSSSSLGGSPATEVNIGRTNPGKLVRPVVLRLFAAGFCIISHQIKREKEELVPNPEK
jgi:hypothetical protein